MKRLSSLFLLVVCISLLCFLLTANLKANPEVTDLLPADTIALIECAHFARTWAGWQRSSIGKKLNDPEVPRILELLDLPKSQIAEFKAARAALGNIASDSYFDSLFAKQSVVALLAQPQGQALDSAALLKNLVLIVPAGSGPFSQRQVERMLGPVRSTGATVYQGVPLITISFHSGQTVFCCQHQGLLICALDPKPVQRCIDQSLNRMVQTCSGLQLNQAYQGLKKSTNAQTDLFLYADLTELLRQGLPAGGAKALEMGLLPHHLAILHQEEADHDRLSIIAQVRPAQLTAFTDRYQLAAQVENPVAQRISSETQLYFWTNWFQPKRLWHFCQESCGQEIQELLAFFAQCLVEDTGKTIDEFFDVFGSRFGVFINEQRVPPLSLQALACLYVEVHDQQQVDVMLKQLLAGLQMVTVFTGGTEVVSVIMAGGLLSPAYALVDNHLILADSVGLIEQVQRRGGVTPANGEKALAAVSDRAGNLFLFIRAKSMAARVISMLTALEETAGWSNVLSLKHRLLIEHAVLPLLLDLQRMETASLRGSAAGDEMILEMDFASGGDFRLFSL